VENIQVIKNKIVEKSNISLNLVNEPIGKKAHHFHESFEQYSETPLVDLEHLAGLLGVKKFFVKDESFRFGLNAFKVLGGSYAIGNYIAQKLGKDIDEIDYKTLISKEVKDLLGDITFITATDGNHGRGVAWTANVLNQKAIVYMPKGTSKERLDNILSLGAKAEIKDLNYDECVRLANEEANKYGYVMVQDTAWDGYEDIPTWIIQGYTTMAYESYSRLKEMQQKPTHIFLQAGVGSMAAAMTGFFSSVYPEDEKPTIVIVEPDKANCIFETAKANDGKLHFITGDMNTIMAGLACGEPCTIAWKILNTYADYFISVPENVAALGMRVLGNPLKGDKQVISGESGAVTAGVVTELLSNESYRELRTQLNLNEESVVLCFSTEGDTDFNHYRKVVWQGIYPNL